MSNQIIKCWKHFPQYEKMLWKIVWEWSYKSNFRFEPQDLFNELVVLYGQLVVERKLYQNKNKTEFGRLLWKICWNALYDKIVRKNSKEISIEIENILMRVDRTKVADIFKDLFLSELFCLVRSMDGRKILDLILNEREDLEKIRNIRRNKVIRHRELNKSDLWYFLKKKGWEWQRFRLGVLEVETALNVMSAIG